MSEARLSRRIAAVVAVVLSIGRHASSAAVAKQQPLFAPKENECVYAAPQTELNYADYKGTWYEIGRIQTPGGAFFQKDCVCTTLNVSFPDPNSSNGTVYNNCRFLKPDGRMVSLKSEITNMGKDGQWVSTFDLNKGTHVNYTIIEHGNDTDTGEEYSVEYDCGSQPIAGTNYCLSLIHI